MFPKTHDTELVELIIMDLLGQVVTFYIWTQSSPPTFVTYEADIISIYNWPTVPMCVKQLFLP